MRILLKNNSIINIDLSAGSAVADGDSVAIMFDDKAANNSAKDTAKTQSITLSSSEAEIIAHAMNEFYYRQDIESYFKEQSEVYDTEKLLADEDLINNILDEYASNREEANGGEYEASMHWSECLYLAVERFEDELKKYRRD